MSDPMFCDHEGQGSVQVLVNDSLASRHGMAPVGARPLSGHFTCYKHRIYFVLTTLNAEGVITFTIYLYSGAEHTFDLY
jgi:hypothetical protein